MTNKELKEYLEQFQDYVETDIVNPMLIKGKLVLRSVGAVGPTGPTGAAGGVGADGPTGPIGWFSGGRTNCPNQTKGTVDVKINVKSSFDPGEWITIGSSPAPLISNQNNTWAAAMEYFEKQKRLYRV